MPRPTDVHASLRLDLTSAQREVVEAFRKNGYVRAPKSDRLTEAHGAYKKGWEVRFPVRSTSEAEALRDSLREAGLEAGKEFAKTKTRWIVPVYGRKQVQRLLDWAQEPNLPPTLVLRKLIDPVQLANLILSAESEGYRFVTKLLADWRDWSNRFEAPGEAVLIAVLDDELVGVCGLNIDPYVSDAAVARLRHLYVLPKARRTGVGAALVARLIKQARTDFRVVRLRTYNPEAATFYVALGFEPVHGDGTCTHQLHL